MTEEEAQQHREDCRREVLRFLAERAALAHDAGAIRRRINQLGYELGDEDVRAALLFLRGLDLVAERFDPLGASKYWQVTSAGILHHERAS
jgi:chorismate mutase